MFDVDNLKGSLGPDKFEELKGAAVDKGMAFLSGQITSSMNKVFSNKEVAGSISTVTKGLGTGMAVAGMVKNPQMIQELTQNIILGATDTAVKEFTAITGKIAGKIVQIPASIPQKIATSTQTYFNQYKKSLGDIIKEISSEQSEQADKEAENADEKDKKDKTNKAKEKLQKAKDKIDKGLDLLNTYLGEACKYIEEGPDMLAAEVDKRIDQVVTMVNNEVDQVIQDVEKDIDQYCDKIGEKAGMKLADTYNKALRKTAEKQLAVTKTVKQKAMALVFKVKQIAILKVMALTGINIPV